MKKNLFVALLGLLVTAPMLCGASSGRLSKQYVWGTVVDVRKYKVQFPEYTMGGSNPADAPLTSRYYAYQVSIRVDCKKYVGRYETPFNYLPSAFSPDQPIRVRLTKHVMYFDLPNNPDLRIGIVRRSAVCGTNRQ